MIIRDRPAPFRRHCREIRLIVIISFISDDLIKVMITVIDVYLHLFMLAYQLPADACLNMAISINFGQAASVNIDYR